MKFIKFTILLITVLTLTSCASGYQMIEPKSVNYNSIHEDANVKLEYKYDLLSKKYAKKELKKGVKLVAVKITNKTDRDLKFGKDIKLCHDNGAEVYVMNNEDVFSTLKQGVAIYLLYLPLTFLTFNTFDANGNLTSTTPIGYIIGPGITGGNIAVAASANKKFKTELLDYNINGTIIKKGETKHGLIGIKENSVAALRLKVE